MNALSAIDLSIVIAYILGTTLLGGLFAGQQRDLKTYFVGDRNVAWWLVLVSIVATETSTVTFLSVPGQSFNRNGGNMTFLQLSFGYIIGRIVVAWLLLPQYFNGECVSAYQILRERFGPAVQRVASVIFLATRTVADGLRLYLTALLLHQFTGWNMQMSVLAMAAATLVYTYLGGMQAVIWTDLIQFAIYMLGAIVALVILIGNIDGGVGAIVEAGNAADKFKTIDLRIGFDSHLLLLAGVVGGAFFSMASHGADQIMVQRYLCAKSVGQARVALVSSGIVVALQFALFLFIGIGLYTLHLQGGLQLGPDARNDEVFGKFIVERLPTGVVGLVIAAVLAAAMSTLSSSLNSSASATVGDFYKPLRPNKSDQHYLGVSRVATIVWGIAQTVVALVAIYIPQERSVIDRVLEVAGLTTGITLGIFLLGTLNRNATPKGALVGLIVGATTVIFVWYRVTNGDFKLGWPWYAPIGSLTVLIVGTLASRWLGPQAQRNNITSRDP
jgi:solute:Na+ symporter, SSS family